MAWSTKLPKKAERGFLVTFKGVVRQADYAEYPKGNFFWLVLPDCSKHYSAVTAWQRQPKPHKPK